MKLRFTFIVMYFLLMMLIRRHNERKMIHSRTLQFHATRLQYLDSIIGNSDIQCVNQLRMDRRTFGLLCELLRSRGLKASGSLALEEQVCMFLHTLSHHVKNCTIGIRFFRFGETVSRYFNSVLNKVLRLHDVLLRVPGPVPNNYADEKWKRFKNCLGALDGTYIRLCVPENDKPRYRTRKGMESEGPSHTTGQAQDEHEQKIKKKQC
ncbi:DDE Tnp4 domain-containing protein [Citrus sinensis]|uniref:DDE Tnp4 domain-containing protein n=1 Tax=Citrus sinensis TaxID=2711 RepID=A0ACB8NUT2_CITSI|nr:DDE Tnp4 domain-containing protein [Citrus sinensis]